MKIISKLQQDKNFQISAKNTQNTTASIQITQGSHKSPIILSPITNYQNQGTFGIEITLGRYFLNKDLPTIHHSKKTKVINIPYSENYGHCLHDVIPKLLYEDTQQIFDTIYTCTNPLLNSLLHLFEIKFNKIQLLSQEPIEIQTPELSLENHQVAHQRNKQKISLLKNQINYITNHKLKPQIHNRLIYCSRNANNVTHGRQMCLENETHIINLLQHFCTQNNLLFTFFNGEQNSQTMNPLNQLKLFSEAKIVVGPHGSAMSNIIYLNPHNNCSICEFTSGTEIIIQRGSFTKNYNTLYGNLPQDLFNYYLIPFHKDSLPNKTLIDIDNLKEFLSLL